jgi:hypothetical protein
MAEPLRARPGIAAIVALGIAWGVVMHSMGWAQLAHYAQVRAFAAGRADIDPWQWQTRDKAFVDGHFYSVKAPGLPALTLPVYLGLRAADAGPLSRDAARTASRADHPRWAPPHRPDLNQYGFSARRASRVETRVENGAPMIWAISLVGAVLPAIGLLLLVRWVAERLEPGYGTAAAITLGLGTIVMTFAAEYFSHIASATLGFAAFALLYRERQGPGRPGHRRSSSDADANPTRPATNLVLVAAAGLCAGLAVTFEYPLGLLGAILLVYAVARPKRRLARGLAYGAAAVCGAAPALAFNLWALGSPLRFAYSNAVAVQGLTGHAVLGLNDSGFFGIDLPHPGAAVDLLVASRGLLTLTPVVVMAVAGAVLMRRRGRVAEGNVVLAVAVVFFLYNSGYWLPFGGGSPGPRFLIPALPFVALGLATAYRRLPALTLALAIPSVVFMLAGTLTFPLIGDNGTGTWANQLASGTLEQTLLTVVGVRNGWLAALPLIAAVAAAVALAVRATPQARLGDVRPALAAVAAWAVVAILGPTIAGDPVTPLHDGTSALALVGFSLGASFATLLALRYRERRAELGPGRLVVAEPRFERIS